MKKLLFILSLVLITEPINAQGISEFNLYQYDLKIINPAFAGLKKGFEFNTFTQKRIVTNRVINSSMCTYAANISKLRSGIGLIYETNKFDSLRDSHLKAMYNYQHKVSKGLVAFGISLNYSSYNHPNAINTNLTWDIGAAYVSETFFGGVSFDKVSDTRLSGEQLAGQEYSMGFNASLGYNIKNLGKFELVPMVLARRHTTGETYVDINLNSEYKNLIIGGIRYTSEWSSFSFNAGINWKNRMRILGNIYSKSDPLFNKKYEFALLFSL